MDISHIKYSTCKWLIVPYLWQPRIHIRTLYMVSGREINNNIATTKVMHKTVQMPNRCVSLLSFCILYAVTVTVYYTYNLQAPVSCLIIHHQHISQKCHFQNNTISMMDILSFFRSHMDMAKQQRSLSFVRVLSFFCLSTQCWWLWTQVAFGIIVRTDNCSIKSISIMQLWTYAYSLFMFSAQCHTIYHQPQLLNIKIRELIKTEWKKCISRKRQQIYKEIIS